MDPVTKDNRPAESVKPHMIVAVNLFIDPTAPNADRGHVQFFTRESMLQIQAQETVIPFDVIEGIFLTLLQMRINARGQAVGIAPLGTTGPRAVPT